MAALGLALAAPGPAHAGSDDDTFQVTATVLAACIVVASDLSFGVYDPTSASPTDASSTLDVTCTNGAAYTVALDPGAGVGATVSARKMNKGADELTYGLYRNAGRTLVWGQTVGVDTLAGTGTGAVQSLTVYGRIPAGQAAPAGAYADQVTVTVSF
jgi:spore coat protein U-like protein